MDPTEQREIIKDWLDHPGTRLMARKVRVASLGLLRRYDTATPEEVIEIQIARRFFNEQLPRIIEGAMNPDKGRAWSLSRWVREKVLRRR